MLRENWRDPLALVLIGLGSFVAVLFLQGITQLFFAALVGASVMACAFVWLIGDVYSLSWLWGSMGERQTAETLKGLDNAWTCEHDLPREHGNWDHVVVGPPGVFLLDTKRVTQRAIAAGDALLAGRLRYNGANARAAAASLGEELDRRCDKRPWVQAVVVVWGDFPQRRHDENRVIYLHGDELVEWLVAQPRTLSDNLRHQLASVLQGISDRAPYTPA
jgi:hypothetical protein